MLEFINKYLLGATVPISLMLTGLYFLARLKFFPVTGAGRVARALTKNGGESFRALALSLAGTLGVGNIAGVASAIYSGGFGAIFWMWVSACVAAVLKYAEIVLAMRRRIPSHSGFKGGAPYYIKAVLAPHFPRLAERLSTLFALLCVANCLSMGAVMQTGTISEAFWGVFGFPPVLFGVLLALAAFFLLRGGAGSISRVTSALVPFMSLFYIVISLAVIIPRHAELPQLFARILDDAFATDAALGGVLGFLLSRALRFGVMRGLFSNEAGCGTSPTAHISSGSSPCEQGFMGIVEVFVDTVLLCSMTGFVVMLGYGEAARFGESPIRMVLAAYSSAFVPDVGRFVEWAMVFMVLCFGFATVSCLSHYALECVGFLSKRQIFRKALILVYCLAVFLGAITEAPLAWAVSDLTVGVMTLINLAVLFFARREISDETAKYFEKTKNISKYDGKVTKSS